MSVGVFSERGQLVSSKFVFVFNLHRKFLKGSAHAQTLTVTWTTPVVAPAGLLSSPHDTSTTSPPTPAGDVRLAAPVIRLDVYTVQSAPYDTLSPFI